MTDKPDANGLPKNPNGVKVISNPNSTETTLSAFDIINAKADLSKNLNERITSIDYGQDLTIQEQEIKRRYRDLPTAKEENANIKYLGSSYSGVDIKVIAHMYDEVNLKDEHLEKINKDFDVSTEVFDACNNLIGGGLTALASDSDATTASFEEKRQRFLVVAGLGISATLDEPQQKARSIILGSIFQGNNFTFLGVAKMQAAAERLRQSTNAELTELGNRKQDLQELDKVESSSTITLGTLQTLSVQSFREKNAVRALGHSYAKSYTRGSRTIGGSCIFTIFNEHALAGLIRGMSDSTTYGERDTELATLLPDQLPPIDLTIAFANEYGSISDFRLYGVEFFTDGSVFSIEDLLSEQTMNFVCRDADVMTSRGRIRLSRLQRGMHNGKDDKDRTGTSLLFDNQDYYNYLDKLGVRRRLLNR